MIKVPLAAPQKAAIVSSPRIFHGLAPPPPRDAEPRPRRRRARRRRRPSASAGARRRGRGGGRCGAAAAAAPAARRRRRPARRPARRGGGRGGPPPGPNQCHDITVYPDIGLAGGACGGYGLLLDIREADASDPHRRGGRHQHVVLALGDVQQRRHEGAVLRRVGRRHRSRAAATPTSTEWGANALFTIENNKMVFKSYYKMPAAQTAFENCVAHNGSLIPIPGREVMVQGWYQGGISVFDWTDVGEADRDRVSSIAARSTPTRLISGGSWSVYWYNGLHRQLGDRARPRHLRAAAERR